jgi:hypothetical protein
MAFSLEVVDTEVYRMLTSSAYFDIFPIPDNHIAIWQKIRVFQIIKSNTTIFFLNIFSGKNGQC